MSLNQYDPCPCGAGKKIKFCACREHIAEMEKITRMIEGEQFVAALDHINAQLKTLPSEPWLLALKCSVLMRLGEIESLEETSARFIRLQPDNPVAKLNRAMVALARGSLEEAASLYLQAIYSQTLEVTPLLLTVMANLFDFLRRSGQPLSAYLHLELAMDRFEGIESITSPVSAELIQNNEVNLLSRETIPSPPDASETEYAERYREAIAMMYAGDVPHAKTKLEGIQREFGPQSPILIALLHCKLLLIDPTGASETCLRLASDKTLRVEQRAYFYALAIELNPVKTGTTATNNFVEFNLDDEAAVEAKIAATKEITVANDERAKQSIQQMVGEEVPPKLVGDIRLAAPCSDSVAILAPTISVGMIGLFGKQTDKAARLIVLYNSDVLPNRDLELQNVISALGFDVATAAKHNKVPVSHLNPLLSPVGIKPPESIDTNQIPGEGALGDFIRELRFNNIKQARLSAFNGKAFEEAAKDAAYEAECLGVLLHLLASSQSGLTLSDYRLLHGQLGLNLPKIAADEDGFDLVGAAYYYWADLNSLPTDDLLGLARSAMRCQHPEVFQEYQQAISHATSTPENSMAIDLIQRELGLSLAKNIDERLKLLQEYYDALRSAGLPAGQVGIVWFQTLAQQRRVEEANAVVQRVVMENRDDPAVREFLYMMQMQQEQMRQQQASNPNAVQSGLFRRANEQANARAAVEPRSSSGLWTPDQGSAQPAKSESSGSGLWIPGQ
jgi:hypothetical protein